MPLQKLVLASSSPRRQFLLQELGFGFELFKPDVDESFPDTMAPGEVPVHLAKIKAVAYPRYDRETVVITSDTIVLLGTAILNKPGSRSEALDMLNRLSGNTHRVITAVGLTSMDRQTVITEESHVRFRKLSQADIERYVDHFSPYDKAGAYGAQETLPKGYNPCSDEELSFLSSIGKMALVEKSIARSQEGQRTVLIDAIEGSYFNVMGFPIHRVYQAIHAF